MQKNQRALAVFLGLTFGLTTGLALLGKLMGFSLTGVPMMAAQLVVLAAMFIPALVAILTQKLVVKKPLKELGLTIGPPSEYAKAYGLIALVYIANYGLTWLFIQQPDLSLNAFIQQFQSLNPDLTLPMPAPLMLALLALVTLIWAPVFNFLPSLGEELGWRGFLLPRLVPLGKVKAMVISGMIWALWHTPLIVILGFMYGRDIWPGVLLHFLLVTALGIFMGYQWLTTKSTFLAAFTHGVFNAHAYGIWVIIFVNPSKLVVGPAGIIAVGLWWIVALITLNIARKKFKE